MYEWSDTLGMSTPRPHLVRKGQREGRAHSGGGRRRREVPYWRARPPSRPRVIAPAACSGGAMRAELPRRGRCRALRTELDTASVGLLLRPLLCELQPPFHTAASHTLLLNIIATRLRFHGRRPLTGECLLQLHTLTSPRCSCNRARARSRAPRSRACRRRCTCGCRSPAPAPCNTMEHFVLSQ
jgi:hypothetical protein